MIEVEELKFWHGTVVTIEFKGGNHTVTRIVGCIPKKSAPEYAQTILADSTFFADLFGWEEGLYQQPERISADRVDRIWQSGFAVYNEEEMAVIRENWEKVKKLYPLPDEQK